ncbi:hypothetical protein O3P69_006657 [Scylla paramamosain]|uniref:Uncharacterized protein n=1 Tax=Scylla paramamosain TaxID=85552 RepID=A0AAW0U3I4_SCYPA
MWSGGHSTGRDPLKILHNYSTQCCLPPSPASPASPQHAAAQGDRVLVVSTPLKRNNEAPSRRPCISQYQTPAAPTCTSSIKRSEYVGVDAAVHLPLSTPEHTPPRKPPGRVKYKQTSDGHNICMRGAGAGRAGQDRTRVYRPVPAWTLRGRRAGRCFIPS